MKKKLLLVVISSFCFIGLLGRAMASDLAEQPIFLDQDGTLSGSLLLPANRTKMTVALIIAGSGPTDRDGNAPGARTDCLRLLARQLALSGIATVRYDKRGVGQSKSTPVDESALRFETYVKDASNWVKKLRLDGRFEHVVVIGHSEGALIGMLASTIGGADAVISIAGVSQSADEVLRLQMDAKLPPELRVENEKILSKLKSGSLVQDIAGPLANFYRPSVQPYLISWFAYDPVVVVKSLTVPVLILQGDHDIQVTPEAAQKLFRSASGSVIHVIPGMNHVLKIVPEDMSAQIASYNQPELPIANTLTRFIVDFIHSVK